MRTLIKLVSLVGAAMMTTASAADYETVKIGKYRAHATQVLAKFKSDVSPAARLNGISSERAMVIKRFQLANDMVVLELEPEPTFNSTLPLDREFSPRQKLLQRIEDLQATGMFEFVEPDYLQTIDLAPTDSSFNNGLLWGLKNNTLPGADIDAETAWNVTTGSSDVIVAVIDTGIRYTHQDLETQMWQNPGEVPGNGVDDDNDGYVDNVFGINAINNRGDPMDDNNHGTHVAGTIGAQANGGGGHVGVVWNVQLMACKFLNEFGSGTTSDAIECINFAIANGAKILNNSWGGGPFSLALLNTIYLARDEGVLFVAAASNDGMNNDTFLAYPASYGVENIISVAALDRFDRLANFSNYGESTVHLGAPGVDIWSSTAGSDGSYATFNGTSMASPHVAGVAALVWSHVPGASMAEVRQRILSGVVPVDALDGKTITGGRLNALNALNVSADGALEINISSQDGFRVIAGQDLDVFVLVTDLLNINNATVTGTLSTGGNVTFLNNGVAPDAAFGDGVYTATIAVPAIGKEMSLTVNASAPGKTSVSATANFVIDDPPPNDLFANATDIANLPFFITGDNAEASSEKNEPNHVGISSKKSVWYRISPTQRGLVRMSTAGSTFNTVMGMYLGNTVGNLAFVANNDNAGNVPTSEIVAELFPGLTYYVAVDGAFGDFGKYQFTVESNSTGTNDLFASRTPIPEVNSVTKGFNVGSTVEFSEPNHAGRPPRKTVWWEWDNTSVNGPVTLSTAGSSFDTLLAVYTGEFGPDFTEVASNIDAANGYDHSELVINAVPNQNYKLVVDSAGLNAFGQFDTGLITLSLTTTPDNDAFANARTITGTVDEVQGWNIGATGEPGEVEMSIQKSVWWKWLAPTTGNATLTTEGSSFDTTVDVFTGTSVNDLELVAFNNDRNAVAETSLVTFPADEGGTYYFRVGGKRDDIAAYTDSGQINLTLHVEGASKLDDPVFRNDNTITVRLLGEPERPYILATSLDLIDWNPIATNSPVTQQFFFNHPVPDPNELLYYRANPVGLLGDEAKTGQIE